MRVLVCGSRDWVDYDLLAKTLDALPTVTALAHGAARGADRMAGQWAAKRNVPVSRYPADWKREGRGAGFARNRRMLEDFRPDEVIGFKEFGSLDLSLARGGTEHMTRIAARSGVYTSIVCTDGLVYLVDAEGVILP